MSLAYKAKECEEDMTDVSSANTRKEAFDTKDIARLLSNDGPKSPEEMEENDQSVKQCSESGTNRVVQQENAFTRPSGSKTLKRARQEKLTVERTRNCAICQMTFKTKVNKKNCDSCNTRREMELVAEQMDVKELSRGISELQNLQNTAYLKAINPQLLQTLQFGLNMIESEKQKDIERRKRAVEYMSMDKNALDGGDTKKCSLYKGFFHMTANPNNWSNPFREKGDRLDSNVDDVGNLVLKVCDEAGRANAPLRADFERIEKYDSMMTIFTKYGRFEKIKEDMLFDDKFIVNMQINCSGELFAVSPKSLNVFNLNPFIDPESSESLASLHVLSQSTNNSCCSFSWSPEDSNILVTVDYRGHTRVQDVASKTVVREWYEHVGKIWNIDFNKTDKNLFATAGDDHYVKLFNINCPRAVAQIYKGCSVCSVSFHPSNRNQLIVSNADHKAYLHDLRNIQKTVTTFEGHKRAVAQTLFLNNDEFVTSSTDNSLKVWNVNSGECISTLRGHTNQYSFCALSSSGDHIISGSELNDLHLFYKNGIRSLAKYTFDELEKKEEQRVFVSTAEWIPNTDYILAANNLGKINLLKLS